MRSPEASRRLPKAELHVHLDGSLRPDTLIELARSAGVSLPSSDPALVAQFMAVRAAGSLDRYLERFAITVAVLQSAEAIERVAWEMVEDAARDGIRYLEVRYCAALSLGKGLSLDEVLAAQWRGLERGGRQFGVRTAIISCTLRHLDPSLSLAIAEASVRGRERGVVGFDIAGGEARHPAAPHAGAFARARAGGLGITVHAGEAAGPASIREAIEQCGARRLGHATRLPEDPALTAAVRREAIAIEACLSSNVQTGAVPSIEAHPLPRWLEAGQRVTLCTDNWLMSDVTLSGEYALAQRAFGLSDAQVDTLILNGFQAAFLPEAEREMLVRQVRAELEAIA
jgi:adenosine deaminase